MLASVVELSSQKAEGDNSLHDKTAVIEVINVGNCFPVALNYGFELMITTLLILNDTSVTA